MDTYFRQQLALHLPHQSAFLISLSGGVDSMVLLHLLAKQPNLNLRAVHIHHGLSPNADAWLTFCQQRCQDYGIPFISRKVNVKGNDGTEANARNARYQAIAEMILSNEVLVTAHHLDDQAETFLLALKRGSGIKGLSAMQVLGKWQHFTLFRPLLGIEKTEIECFAQREHLHWINDESNENDCYDRNFLRLQILPKLNQRWHYFSQNVARTAQHCTEQQILIEELLSNELAQRMRGHQQFDITNFEQFSLPKQKQLIRLWLEKCQVRMPATIQLQTLITELIGAGADKNPQMLFGDKVIRRWQKSLFILDKKMPIFPSDVEFMRQEAGEFICKIANKIYRLPLPLALHHQPLVVKFGHQGKVQEYGKLQREEMKKIWQKNRIPPWERAYTPLVFWQDQLVFVLKLNDEYDV